jgi:hypothetical protein
MTNPFFKFKTFFLPLLAASSTLLAAQGSCSELTRPLLEAKAGYFFFSNSEMRKVYDRGGLDLQLSVSYPLWNLASGWTLNAYGAVEYLHCSGRSINDHQKTALWSIPVNIGLKPIYAINANTQYYFAIGPRYFYLHQHNDSSYVYRDKAKNGLGFFVNTGFHWVLCEHFVFDVFGEYSYAKTHFRGGDPLVYTRNIQVGGFTFGGGIGYKF